jgi:3-hydroxyisobutyrate dehydrogenase-like beta-hydroxyacid dehydrogenase
LSPEKKFRVITNLTGRSERTQKLSHSVGIIDVQTDEEIINQADFIISILVPAAAKALAQRFAPLLTKNKHIIYVDMNAIAPQTLLSIASLFPHGNFVDGCVIGPPPGSKERKPTMYLSGEHAQKVADLFQDSDLMNTRVIGNQTEHASAFKMCYASLSKGHAAIAIQACVTAKSFGLDGIFFDELKQSMPAVFSTLNRSIVQMPPKAGRWVGEMEEIAKTYEDIGLSPKLFQGAADTYRFVAEETILGKEIIEERKRGQTLDDALGIMVESLEKNKKE